MQKTYETIDLELAATLYALGAKLDDVRDDVGNKKSFVFRDSDDVQKWVDGYWRRDLAIEPQHLLNALRMLKSRTYA